MSPEVVLPHERPVAGRSVVTRRAILDIVRTAVQGSYGVTGIGNPSVWGRLKRGLHLGSRGIELSTDADGLVVDLFLTVAYGVPVAEVARQVDSAVRYAMRRATGQELSCVSIHVGGLRYQPSVSRREAAAATASPEKATQPSQTAAGQPSAPDAEADMEAPASRNGTGRQPADGHAGSGTAENAPR